MKWCCYSKNKQGFANRKQLATSSSVRVNEQSCFIYAISFWSVQPPTQTSVLR